MSEGERTLPFMPFGCDVKSGLTRTEVRSLEIYLQGPSVAPERGALSKMPQETGH